MGVKVREIIKLDNFKKFRLIAGASGIDNDIDKVGILEYEVMDDFEGLFNRGDFVITSFFFAKDDINLVKKSIDLLVESFVGALAIKNVYYDNLPDEIIDYANENALPIFVFDKDIMFEDVITDIMDCIRNKDNHRLIESKIDVIINSDLSKGVIRQLALEINSCFNENVVISYCRPRKYLSEENIIDIVENIKRFNNIDIGVSILKYKMGILVIYSYEKDVKTRLYDYLNCVNLNKNNYYIGISNNHSLKYINTAIQESLYCMKYNVTEKDEKIYYRDIGIYKMIMPFIDTVWAKNFYEDIINPLKDYDVRFNSNILDTAIKYIECDCNIKQTSDSMFQHGNTIRYRINKMKEILKMDNLEASFNEQLSIAIKIYKILENDS
ncbi:PucR family transcriptional regulator [Tepidibacter hydrothermalis]|uniref:PucR family transcriptional regulator n=1 Tax=Tepidibacter hydrothermalis TaxID=3036126 RepID=A0ABY8EH09_9FIRM|nr:PucR family transcriptional regulator [Tepidibacter hydrothermalis]WFD11140.1 PucR family transcriptional regulator [Tepidibacter hydrothermalis]